MKTLAVLVLSTVACFGQANFAAGGASWEPGGTPSVAMTGMYAHSVDNSGTYAFSVIDALPVSYKPFTITSQVGVGVAQKVLTIGTVPIFVPTAAGVAWTGTNTGWTWSTGAMGVVKLKGSASVAPNVRVVKSSINQGSGYQVIVGVMFGWSW